MWHRPHCPKWKWILVSEKTILELIWKPNWDIYNDFIEYWYCCWTDNHLDLQEIESMSYTKEKDLWKLRCNSFDWSDEFALWIITQENKRIEEMEEEWELEEIEQEEIAKEIEKQLFEIKWFKVKIPHELVKEYMITLRN